MSALEKQNMSRRELAEHRPDAEIGEQTGRPGASSDKTDGHGKSAKTPWYTIVALLVIAGAIGFAFRGPLVQLVTPVAAPPPVAAKPPSITITRAVTGPITESVVVTGNLVAREEILVSPQIDGYAIDQILVEEGDHVSEGQVMAQLSRTTIDTSLAQNEAQTARAEAAIAQAQSSIAEAQANKDQAVNAYARSQSLQKSGNTTTDTLEQREAAAKMADARLDAAQHALTVAQADKKLADAQRDELMVRLEHTQIKAPAAGIVSRRTARIGAVAAGSGDALFRIIRDGDVELEADVPESTLARILPDMKASVFTAARKDLFAAHVRLVSPEVSPTTRLGRVRIAIDKAPGLTVGAFGRATVEVASRSGVLVPQSAILYSEDGPTVQVVHDGLISTKAVTIGLRTEKQAEIEKGVAEGDSVVATAGTFVRDGDKVTPVDPQKPASSTASAK